MNMASLVIGFILGVISTFIFNSSLKLSVDKVSGDQAAGDKLPMIKSLKANSLWGIFILVPILAGLIYWKVGSPDVPSLSVPTKTMSSTMTMGANSANHEMGDLSVMAQRLAAKQEKNPENADGWALLAHTYVEIKQHKEAVGAFEKAVNLIPNDPQLFADYADALAVTNNGQFDAKTSELVEQALKLDPNHPKALLLAGTIAFKQANYIKAINIWQQLQPLIDKEDSALMHDVAANIAEANSLISKK